MKKTAIALVFAALFVFSGCSSTTSKPDDTVKPVNVDEVFLDLLIEEVPSADIYPDESLLDMGHAVCEDFDNGTSFFTELQAAQELFSPDDSAALIGLAIGAFCPEHEDVLG